MICGRQTEPGQSAAQHRARQAGSWQLVHLPVSHLMSEQGENTQVYFQRLSLLDG